MEQGHPWCLVHDHCGHQELSTQIQDAGTNVVQPYDGGHGRHRRRHQASAVQPKCQCPWLSVHSASNTFWCEHGLLLRPDVYAVVLTEGHHSDTFRFFIVNPRGKRMSFTVWEEKAGADCIGKSTMDLARVVTAAG
eukprot:2085474-Amphidinium_carterae.1